MKIFGMIFIFIACSLAGIICAAHNADAIKYTEALISLVSFIKFKISGYRSELSEIYSEYENDYLKNTGFLQILRNEGFKSALLHTDSRIKFPENENRVLSEFADKLGHSDVEDQITNIDTALAILGEHYKKLKEQYPSQRKLYISLGMLSGALAVIILF